MSGSAHSFVVVTILTLSGLPTPAQDAVLTVETHVHIVDISEWSDSRPRAVTFATSMSRQLTKRARLAGNQNTLALRPAGERRQDLDPNRGFQRAFEVGRVGRDAVDQK